MLRKKQAHAAIGRAAQSRDGRATVTTQRAHRLPAPAFHTQSLDGDWRRTGNRLSQLMETWKFVSFRRRLGWPVRRATGRRTGLWGTRPLLALEAQERQGSAASTVLLEAVEGDRRARARDDRPRRCGQWESHADCEAHCAKCVRPRRAAVPARAGYDTRARRSAVGWFAFRMRACGCTALRWPAGRSSEGAARAHWRSFGADSSLSEQAAAARVGAG